MAKATATAIGWRATSHWLAGAQNLTQINADHRYSLRHRTVIILIALAPTTEIRLMVAGVVYSILFLDWLAMLVAHIVVRWFSPLLLLLGVVLGVTPRWRSAYN